MNKHTKNLLTLAVMVLAVGSVQASPVLSNQISGLYNTGEGIAVDKVTDLNYKLSDSLGNAVYGGYGEAAVGNYFPISPWLSDNGVSHWLTPTNNRAQSYDPSTNGLYKWTLDFDLTGYNAATASLSGRFAADNNAIAYLNGNSIGSAAGFSQWYNFAAASNLFVSGINKLEFVVTNLSQSGGNPTGLRVEFTGSNVSAVPVPGAVWLFMSGMIGLMGLKRKSVNL